jgi:hypothetical protein
MAMLRRRVERVVVFINTYVPIETEPSKIKTRFDGMDTALMSFFGYGLYHDMPELYFRINTYSLNRHE